MQHRQENTIVWAAGGKAAEMMDRYFGQVFWRMHDCVRTYHTRMLHSL